MDDVRAATALAQARPAYAAGLRAALATATPLLLDHLFHTGGGTWMSVAGFLGALADKGGPYRSRAGTMLALTLGGGAAAAFGAVVAGHPAVAVPVTFLVAVACGLARAYRTAGVSLSIGLLNVYVISLAYPPMSPGDPAARLAWFLAGGAWAMLLSLVLWPLRPYRRVREAVAAAYRAVAEYADYLAARTGGGDGPAPLGVRPALELARAALATVRRGRPGETGRGERLLVLGETADQIYGNLFGLSDELDSLPPEPKGSATHRALAEVARDAGETLRSIAAAIEDEDHSLSLRVGWNGDLVRRSLEAPGDDRFADTLAHYRQAAQILDRVAQYAGMAAALATGLNAGSPLPPIERRGEIEDPEPPLPWLVPLRAALSPDSLIARHALRLGLITAIAVGLTAALGLQRGYWVTITAVIILQPYVGATSLRAVQRVLGTVVGGALAALLAAWFHSPVAVLVLVFVFAAVSVALLPLNYAVFSVFLTPTFVLLAEASAGDWHLAGLRIGNTLIGGALAMLGTWLLWPSPEAKRMPEYLAEVLEAMRAYLAEVIARFDDRSDAAGAAIRGGRRRVGLAILNAEESLERVLSERRGRADDVTPAMTLVTYARRFTASIAALALSRHSVAPVPAGALEAFASAMDLALADLAAALAEGRPPRPLDPMAEPADPTLPPLLRGRLTRLRRQLKTLHDAIERQQDKQSS
jgi:uncharacterized membrane protein YccC